MPTWHLSWKWYEANREFLAGRGESVVAALRDVLAVPEGRVRRGAAERCTDWEDLRRRLDWVLQTLPTDSAVVITSPTGRTTTVQFMTHFRDDTIATSAIDPDLDPANPPEPVGEMSERARRMFEIGWKVQRHYPDVADWTLGDPVVWADIGPLATQAVEALRALG